MKLKIIQFNYGNSSGSGTAHLYGPQPESALKNQPYLSLNIGFTVHQNKPDFDPNKQILVPLQPNANRFVRVGIIYDQAVGEGELPAWPRQNEYLGKLARLIANMVLNAELSSLEDPTPTVLS